jgi:ABC-type amino acid transport substrate-binding protein
VIVFYSQRSTGVNFHLSTTYYYDGLAYFGNETFVRCAEDRKRHGECSLLRICALNGTTGYDFVRSNFPTEYIVATQQSDELRMRLANNTCNVIARDFLLLPRDAEIFGDRQFVSGNKSMTIEPLSIVTRGDDDAFAHVVDFIVNALFYGQEQRLTKNMSRCSNNTPSAGNISDLNFMNAVYCVGNYEEVMPARLLDISVMNQINDGSTGMLYASPFGDLNRITGSASTPGPDRFHQIKERGYLKCGVLTPAEYPGILSSTIQDWTMDNLVGMSVDYCRAVAAAIFHGDDLAVELIPFSEEDADGSIAALVGFEIDVLSRAWVKKRVGIHFSEPYFYGA